MSTQTSAKRALRFLIPILAAVALGAATAACGDDDQNNSVPTSTATASHETTTGARDGTSAFPLTLIDSSGEEIEFTAPPERIISYSPGATEILFAIGAGDRLVAVDRFSDYPAEARDLPQLEYSDPAPEPALAYEPDLVFMATRQEGQVEQFRALGMTVVLLHRVDDLEAVMADIEMIGSITGEADGAHDVIEEMRSRITAVEAAVSEIDEGPRVYYELSPSHHTVSPDTFVGSLMEIVKARNIAIGATTDFPELSAEVILDADPEVILVTHSDDPQDRLLQSFADRPGWDAIDAVANGRVYAVDSDLYNRPGPRIVNALEDLLALLYPDQS